MHFIYSWLIRYHSLVRFAHSFVISYQPLVDKIHITHQPCDNLYIFGSHCYNIENNYYKFTFCELTSFCQSHNQQLKAEQPQGHLSPIGCRCVFCDLLQNCATKNARQRRHRHTHTHTHLTDSLVTGGHFRVTCHR